MTPILEEDQEAPLHSENLNVMVSKAAASFDPAQKAGSVEQQQNGGVVTFREEGIPDNTLLRTLAVVFRHGFAYDRQLYTSLTRLQLTSLGVRAAYQDVAIAKVRVSAAVKVSSPGSLIVGDGWTQDNGQPSDEASLVSEDPDVLSCTCKNKW